MSRKIAFALAVCLGLIGGTAAAGAAAKCVPEDFGKAVDQAGLTLRAFNLENAPKLQTKLAILSEKKKWPEEEREEKARDFLQDKRISALDTTANELLVKIDTLGRPSEKAPPDCAKLDDLKAAGVELLAVMKTKSTYTMEKIEAALDPAAKPPAQAPKAAAVPLEARPKRPVEKPPLAKKDGREAPSIAAERKDGEEPKSGDGKTGRPADTSSWSTTSKLDPSLGRNPLPPSSDIEAAPDAPLPGVPYANEEEGYTIDEIREATRGFFGTISTNLASVLEYAFSTYGRPTAYVLGSEGGGAFLAGVRYGSGTLYLHRDSTSKVYWHGPSLGYDFGAEGSRTMFLIYKLRERDSLFRRFTGVDGSAYLVGGVGITFLKGGEVLMAPIRSGLGLRLGANIGYIRFTPEPSWNPF